MRETLVRAVLSAFLLVVLSVGAADVGQAAPESTTLIKGVEPGRWTMDLEAAKVFAKGQTLPILMYFTGSDWCGYCKGLERDVLAKQEWTDYAREKLVLVKIDVPRNKDLLPLEYRARNDALMQEFGVQGPPSFALLDHTGKKVGDSFGLQQQDYQVYRFIRVVGQALRRDPRELATILDGLPDDKARSDYRAAVKELDEARRRFETWLEGKPERNEENVRIFEQHKEKLDSLENRTDRVEIEGTVRNFSKEETDRTRNTKLVQASRDYVAALGTLQEAQGDLESWLLGRPKKSKENAAVFEKLLGDVKQAHDKLRAID